MSNLLFVAGSANSTNNGGTSGPASVAYSAAIQQGDLLIVKIAGGNQATSTFIVTDTNGNNYKLGLYGAVAAFSSFALYWAIANKSAAANANIVQMVIVPNAVGFDACVGVYRNFPGYPYVKQSSFVSGNSATASATVDVQDPTALIVGGANVANTVTGVGGGSTNRITDSFGDNLQDIIVSSRGGPYTPTATQTAGQWVMGMVAFVPIGPVRGGMRPVGL